jgi:hypothetical protein
MTTLPNIPDAAVEAAMAALGEAYGDDARCREREYVLTTLESAAPHLLADVEQSAWQMGYSKGYQKAWQEAKSATGLGAGE